MKLLIILISLSISSAMAKTAIVMKKDYMGAPAGTILMVVSDARAAEMNGEYISLGKAEKIKLLSGVESLEQVEIEGYLDGENWKVRARTLSTSEQKKKDRRVKIKLGKEKKEKCQNALNFMNGFTNEMDEATVDAMETGFASIYAALKGNRLAKSKRLIALVSDPGYLILRDELLAILE